MAKLIQNNLTQKIKKAPNNPGVYLFKNQKEEIIYVGRSINLKKRLENYLHPKYFKTISLVKEAKSVSFKTTKNFLDAVILEANLIKKYEPKYNVREKDSRSFVYIVIPKKPWTYPMLVRGKQLEKYSPKKTKAEIFGPFQSLGLTKNLSRLLRRIFPYSTCQLNASRPCFDYQIGLCPGKCIGIITEKEYQKNINNLILFLKGEKEKVKKKLKKTSPEKIKLLENIDDSILISHEKEDFDFGEGRIEGYDISHFSGKETFGAMVVFEDGDFNKNEYRLFKIRSAKPNDDLSALEETLERRLNHKEWTYPNLILVDGGKTQVSTLNKVLDKKKINIPVIGISKFQFDKLVFSKKIDKSLKGIISLSFDELKKIRDEAHRFTNSARKRSFQKHLLPGK